MSGIKKKIGVVANRPVRQELKFTFKESPPDQRDHYAQISVAQYAQSVDLSGGCSSVKNQGSIGACTAFGCIVLLEYLQRKNGNMVDYSELFTYYMTRVEIEKCPPQSDDGAYIRDAIKSLIKYGSCMEQTFPFTNTSGVSDVSLCPSQKAREQAMNYQILAYAKLDDGINQTDRAVKIQNIKNALQAGNPVVCGFDCYENIWDCNKAKGVIQMPKGKKTGGHCVALVGYNDVTKLFKFKNSWSAAWGDKGYGYLPYAYYLNGWMHDMWIITDTEFENKSVVNSKITIFAPSSTGPQYAIAAKNLMADIWGLTDSLCTKEKSEAAMQALQNKYSKTLAANLLNQLSTVLRSIKEQYANPKLLL